MNQEKTVADRDNIIDKIKKCLALSASSNEHEAAAALRQAKKLMEAHSISDLDVHAAEANEKRARAGAIKRPANWEAALANSIGDAFGCEVLFSSNWNYGEWTFIGTGAAPEVAEYSFKVLFRQAKASRAEHIKARLKRCKPATKTRRADLYCEGWVRSVTALITKFSGSDTNQKAVDAYMATRYPSLVDLQCRDRNADRNLNRHEEMDSWYGSQSGRNASLNRGVGGAEEQKAIQ